MKSSLIYPPDRGQGSGFRRIRFRCLFSFLFLIALNLAILVGHAAEAPLANEIIPAGSANLGEVKKTVEPLLTPRGKVIILPLEQKIFLQDTPENLPFVVAVVRAMTAPKPNVRIEVTTNEIGQHARSGISIRGSGNIHVEPIQRNELNLSGFDQNGGTDSLSSQMLLVQSGGEATLEVVHELVVADYFPGWIQQNGYTEYVPTNFRWEKIGSFLRIKPVATGEYVTIDLTPLLTSLDGATVVLKALTTQVTLMNGTSTQIGSFAKASQEFDNHFFGGSSSGASNGGSITLKATIEPVAVVPGK